MLDRVIAEAAERFGDRTAYVAADGWTLSYRALHRLSDEVAVGLAEEGVGEGDVVALVLPIIPDYVVAYLAAAKLGAVTAGVNARLAPGERAAVLMRARPKVVIATPELAPDRRFPAGGNEGDVRSARVVEVAPAGAAAEVLEGLRELGGRPSPLAPDPDRPVAIVFTSGTTGTPKGATFCGRQLAAITTIDTGDRWGGGGSQLAATSFAHLGPMTKLPGVLHRGGTSHVLREWHAGEALRLVAEHGISGLGGIPTQIALMLRHPDFDRLDLACVRAVVMGGGPAGPALVRAARERFGAAVAVRYSCTEAAIGTGTRFDDPPEDAEESVGRAQPGVTLTVRSDTGEVQPPGEHGEVCLASAATMSGYCHDPAATREAFTDDGAVRTGDVGFLDERGRLHLAGRRSEMYVRGGYNVFPVPVEAVLARHPGVADVAVVAAPDPVMGEVGVAVVVPAPGVDAPTLEALRAFAGAELARHELPERQVVVDDLPRTAMDKLDRRALAKALRP